MYNREQAWPTLEIPGYLVSFSVIVGFYYDYCICICPETFSVVVSYYYDYCICVCTETFSVVLMIKHITTIR